MTNADQLDLEALKLAFLQHMVGRVSQADRTLTDAERAAVARICPPAALVRAGLTDASGAPTALTEPAKVRALMELPGALSEADRLALLTPLAQLATVDGGVDLREQSYVAAAGQLLALPLTTIAAHLAGSGVRIAVR